MGVSRSAGRVARRRIVSALAAYRLACVRLIGSAVLIAGPRESRTTLSSRDERSCLPRCHPHSAMPHLRDRRRRGVPVAIGAALYRWRSAPEPTGSAAAAAFRSVRRLPGPFPAVVAPVSTSHRVSLPTLDGYSSRSQPVLRDVGG